MKKDDLFDLTILEIGASKGAPIVRGEAEAMFAVFSLWQEAKHLEDRVHWIRFNDEESSGEMYKDEMFVPTYHYSNIFQQIITGNPPKQAQPWA